MSGSFEKLKQMVECGEVRIVQVVGVPRSMSTALERSLAEMAETAAYVNEPFNVQNNDIHVAADHVLKTFQEKGRPSVIVTKSLAPQMSRETFDAWMAICESVVWSIRNPLTQLGSLATRVVHDRYIPSGVPAVTQKDVYPYLDRLAEHWELTKFALPGWAALGEHYSRRSEGTPMVVIDGEHLVSNPESILREACKCMPYTFRMDMVDNWRPDLFNNANHAYPSPVDDAGLPIDAWIRKAAAARGLEPNAREALDVERLPLVLRRYIEGTALPVYRELSEAALKP